MRVPPTALRRLVRVLAATVTVTAMTACGGDGGGGMPDDPEPTGATSLVEHALWAPVEAAADPFDDRPAAVSCDPLGYSAEDLAGEQAFGVFTRQCDYITACQPTQAPLVAGDKVKVRAWNFELSATEPDAEAHLAISLDGAIAWETSIPIPADAGLHNETVTIDADYPDATQVCFHAHNHGLNEYYLIELARLDFATR